MIVIRDITDRSLRHLQERFIDTASHEFPTPLAALHNYMALVERGARQRGRRQDQEVRRRGDRADPPAGRARRPPVDVSLIRHGRTVVRLGPVEDLGAVVEESVEQARHGGAGPSDRAAPAAREGRRGRRPDAAPPADRQPARERDHARRLGPCPCRSRSSDAVATSRSRSRTPDPGIPPEGGSPAMFTPFTPRRGPRTARALGSGCSWPGDQSRQSRPGGTLQLDAPRQQRDRGPADAPAVRPKRGGPSGPLMAGRHRGLRPLDVVEHPDRRVADDLRGSARRTRRSRRGRRPTSRTSSRGTPSPGSRRRTPCAPGPRW